MRRKPISDLDLYSHLKRRAADGRFELSRDGFAASVRSKIDSGPASVRVSRAPALVGLASVVAVLLVLVVALPILRPGPAATAPGASPSSATQANSASEFQRRFSAGELKGQSVLVNGRIEPFDTGFDCTSASEFIGDAPPSGGCVMGRIVGTEPNLWATAAYLAEAPERWRAAVPPAEGTLLLHVAPDGSIEYIGTVAVTAGEPSSVRAASALHLESLELDDVVLVDASLAGVGYRECPAFPSSVPGLTGRGCEPSMLSDGSGSMTVQDNAYYNFAPDPDPKPTEGVVTPRRALYAIAKRLEGCSDTPCWQWNVVARLSGSTGPVATPPVEPAPTSTSTPMPGARFVCSPDRVIPGSDVVLPLPVVIDMTGLVESCEIAESTTGHNGVWVTNLIGDANVLHVEWSGNPCDQASTFTLERSAQGYGLNGERPTGGCSEPLGRFAMRVDLSAEVDAATVVASLPPDGPAPNPIPPDGAPAPTPSAADGCEGIVADETGLIERCESADGPDGTAAPLKIVNPGGDHHTLEVTWADVCEYAARFALKRAQAGFELVAFSDKPMNVQCDGFPQGHVVTLQLREPIAAELVDITSVLSGIWRCAPEPPYGNAFTELHATLHDETGLATGSCLGRRGEAETANVPALNPGGDQRVLQLNWTGGTCDAEIDFTLSRLDTGGYLAHGVPGDGGCIVGGGAFHSLVIQLSEDIDAADVLVEVDRQSPVPSPTPVAAQDACTDLVPEADYAIDALAYDTTGFVTSCEFVSPQRSDFSSLQMVRVDNPNGDPDKLRVSWLGGACDGPLRIHFDQTSGGYEVWLESDRQPIPDITPGPCIMVGVIRAVQFELSQPIDASQVTLR